MTTVSAWLPTRPAAAGAVDELLRLFARLHAEAVPYCHWKSNEHLGASLTGATDLDLLVDRQAAQTLQRILSESSFKRLVTAPVVAYPGVESYLGLDAQTGALLHLHVHYQLTLGEKHLKGYRLPWESLLLGTRRLDEGSGVYVVDPHLELLLLMVRAALKLRWRDVVAAALGRPYVRGGLRREFGWLVERVDPDRLAALARPLVGEPATRLLIGAIRARALPLRSLMAFARTARPWLEPFRFSGRAVALRRRWVREAVALGARFGLTRRRAPTLAKRGFAAGGLWVAVIGVDGAGKSTVAHELVRWLSPLLDALPVYLGSGKGPMSLPRRTLEAVVAAARRAGGAPPAAPAGAPGRGRRTSWVRTCGELLWLLALARERRARLRRLRRARNVGMVVVTDRLLQTQVPDFNDGPAFQHWLEATSWLLRAGARAERAALEAVHLQPPDLVIRLHVTPELAKRRRPAMAVERLRRGVATIATLRFPAPTRVVDIDATQPFVHVLLQAKRALWEHL